MGEIAEMMLDGTMCQVCGEFMNIGGEPAGYPVTCAGCGDDDKEPEFVGDLRDPKTVACPNAPSCEKMFRSRQAAGQHWIDKH